MVKRINYDEFTVRCNGEPSKEALMNYYNIMFDLLIKKFGKDAVRIALEELINED